MPRQAAGRPIIIALVVLGVAVISVLTIQIRLLLRTERSAARADRDDPIPAAPPRDYELSAVATGIPARPSHAPVPQASAEANPADETMPPGPISLHMTPEQATRFHLNKELKALERSGRASSTLTADALKAVDNMKRLPPLAGAEFSGFRCYGDGCVVTVTSRSTDNVGPAISRSRDFFSWPGSRFMSGPLPLASGQVQTVLVLHGSRGEEPSHTTR
jgi:hypothetical protein